MAHLKKIKEARIPCSEAMGEVRKRATSQVTKGPVGLGRDFRFCFKCDGYLLLLLLQ